MLVGCEWRVLVYLENIFDSFHFSCQSSFGGSSTIVLLTNTAFSWGFFFISFHSIACFCPRFSTFEVFEQLFLEILLPMLLPQGQSLHCLLVTLEDDILWDFLQMPMLSTFNDVGKGWVRDPRLLSHQPLPTSTGPARGRVWPISLHELLQRNTGRSFCLTHDKTGEN